MFHACSVVSLYHAAGGGPPGCYITRARVNGCDACVPVLVLLAAVPACGRSGPPPREFEIVGQIQAVAPERGEVTIKHEDIKGFMPGMTMPFKAGTRRARRATSRAIW